jgi:hypothetical protein
MGHVVRSGSAMYLYAYLRRAFESLSGGVVTLLGILKAVGTTPNKQNGAEWLSWGQKGKLS